MAAPTKKSAAVEGVLDRLTKMVHGDSALTRTEAIKTNNCVGCQKPVGEFSDFVSLKEYRISGLCQTCQDSVFGG